MKKFVPAMLLALVSSSLFGCNKGPSVSYTQISEDEFNTYHSADKVNEAKAKFAEVETFYYLSYQHMENFDYDLFRYFDKDYYYEYAHSVEPDREETSHTLYLGGESHQDYYTIWESENNHYIDESAQGRYQDDLTRDRNLINRSIEESDYVVTRYEMPGAKTYFLGSDSTIKIVAAGGEYISSSITIIDVETLVPIYVVLYFGEYSVTYYFFYNTPYNHLTPDDIGFVDMTN